MSRSGTIVVSVLLLLAGCAPVLSRVPVGGTRADVEALSGRWEGEYTGSGAGRSGTISFHLGTGSGVATGDVVMIPRGTVRPLEPYDSPSASAAPDARLPQVLTITFVHIQAGLVNGVLDPYRDPECGCRLTTTFEGAMKGDLIEGTFITRGEVGHPPQSGEWRVRRVPARR